ncbi:MAG: GNAT family N-acetyltransferase [Pseudomonadota bacterium]
MPSLTSNDLTFRLDDLTDPAARVPIGDLLADIFEIAPAAFNTLPFWYEGYRAFSYLDGEIVAANASSFPLPLVVDGKPLSAGGIQSVATRPAYRGRGLFKDLMARLIADGEARFDCLLLYTDIPALYEPFGFRVLQQHSFFGRLPEDGTAAARRLSLARDEDRALVRRLFAARRAPSERLGLRDHEVTFFLNALWYQDWRLDHLPDVEAMVVHDRCEGRPRLLDIVGPGLPTLECLGALLEAGDQEVEICFPPDRWDATFAARPHLDPEAGTLMARGPFPIEASKVRLPPTADF